MLFRLIGKFKNAINNAKAITKEVDSIEFLTVDTWAEETEKTFKLRQMQNPVMLDQSDGIKVRIENKKKD